MKRLFPAHENVYRAALHAHTTCSDGAMAPSELFASYRGRGYAVVALTDHEKMVPHPECDAPDCLCLSGFEMSFGPAGRSTPTVPTCHIVFLAKDARVAQDRSHPAFWPGEPGQGAHGLSEDCISEVLSRASENGYFPLLCHPFWSLQDPASFGGWSDVAGVEVYNHLCATAGSRDDSGAALDAFLARGRFPLPIASDDCHGGAGDDAPDCDRFGGWEMISAPALTWAAVIEGLEAGQAYATTGPEILDLCSEDGRLTFVCSGVRRARMLSDVRPVDACLNDPRGQITWGSFLIPAEAHWVRLELTDSEGHTAWTRAYRAEEL